MPSSSLSKSNLAINPLGPGDLIDRAIRFYRGNFWTLVLMAGPPVLAGTFFTVVWTILSREYFYTSSKNQIDVQVYSFFLSWLGSWMIWIIEWVAALVVMGGASRNFVRHILFEEPITVKETYTNVKNRIGGLIGASTIIVMMLSMVGGGILYIGMMIGVVAIILVIAAFASLPFLAGLLGFIVGAALIIGTLWLFFLLAPRFAYVPQIMLVEGQGVFSAIGRSTSLASGNVKRFAALFIFSIVATYSALLLLYVPLGWLAWANGLDFFSMVTDPDSVPAWYVIANQVVTQISLILMMPVWMIGLCLLYVDERVRHEGYDIELMAARSLGEIPPLPRNYLNPLQPALSPEAFTERPGQSEKSPMSPLGLS